MCRELIGLQALTLGGHSGWKNAASNQHIWTSAGKLIANHQAQGDQTKPAQSASILVRRQNQAIHIAPVGTRNVWLWKLNSHAVAAIG
jgi:hypothetical protein